MHDRTRRRLCRTGFLLLCVLPTVSVVVWGSVICSPAYVAAHKAAWQADLSRRLGLTVQLQSVQNPSRGLTVLTGLVLRDPETNAPLAQVRRIELGCRGDQWVVLAAQPELETKNLWRLYRALHQRLLCGAPGSLPKVHFYAGELNLKQSGDRGDSTLTDVHCRLTPAETGPQATIEFRDVAQQSGEPAQLSLTRNRQISPPATRWHLRTGSAPLPCYLLADHVAILACLGDRATFQGTVEAIRSPGGWEGEVTGRFGDVDLDRLVTDRYDHKLSGMAEVVFRRARFRGGKLVDAAGDLLCSGGVVSLSLLHQADKSLGLVADGRIRSVETDSLRRYQELKFGFTLTQQGLKIVGLCHDAGEGVVMTDYYGPLLTDRPQEVAQVAALVRTLSSRSGEHVPATYEAYQLLHVLPIPSHTDTPALSARQPIYSPVRLLPRKSVSEGP